MKAKWRPVADTSFRAGLKELAAAREQIELLLAALKRPK